MRIEEIEQVRKSLFWPAPAIAEGLGLSILNPDYLRNLSSHPRKVPWARVSTEGRPCQSVRYRWLARIDCLASLDLWSPFNIDLD
jgi:hypothetical protein